MGSCSGQSGAGADRAAFLLLVGRGAAVWCHLEAEEDRSVSALLSQGLHDPGDTNTRESLRSSALRKSQPCVMFARAKDEPEVEAIFT